MNKQNILVGALVLSLAANVFFVGFAATRFMAHDRGHGPRMAGPDGGMDKAISHLESTDAEKIKAIVDNHRENVRTQMNEMRDLFEQIGPTLSAPQFDPDKLAALSAQIDAHDKAMKADMAAMMSTIAKTLPDEQRIQFFNEMFADRHFPPGGPDRDGKPQGRGPEEGPPDE